MKKLIKSKGERQNAVPNPSRRKFLKVLGLGAGIGVALSVGAGLRVVDRGGIPPRQSYLGLGQKVITLGHVAYAAGEVDYTYDGVDDNIQFQAALDALPATGGRLVNVSAVQLNFSAAVTRAIPNVIIEGAGRGTYFTNNGVAVLFTAGGNNWQFLDLRTDAGGLDMGATTGWRWQNVTIAADYYAYRTPVASTLGADWEIPVGRGATFVVAASDASAQSKAQADYVCPGADDQVQIQAAIDALPAGGGRVVLLEGTYHIEGSITPVSDSIIEGSGENTHLDVYGVIGDYTYQAGGVGGGGGNCLFVLSGLSNLQIRDLVIEVKVDFPEYGVGADFIMIHFGSSSEYLTFEGLHLINKSDSSNGAYGLWGAGNHVVIGDCIEEYCFRGFNSGQDAGGAAEHWLLENCQALHIPDQVPNTITGFEIEDGSKWITTINCLAEDFPQHTVDITAYWGRGFTGGVHGAYGHNMHLRHTYAKIIDCQFGFQISDSDDVAIVESYMEGVTMPVRVEDTARILSDLRIIGGNWINCGEAQIYVSRFLCMGLTILDGVGDQSLKLYGSGVPGTKDDYRLSDLLLVNSVARNEGIYLEDVNGVLLNNVVSRGNAYAITLDGAYARNIEIRGCDLSDNTSGEIQDSATASENILASKNLGFVSEFDIRGTISNLLGILGDARALWPFFEKRGATINDYCRRNHGLTAQGGNVETWDRPPSIQGRMPLYGFNGVDEWLSRASHADFSFGDGATDTAFSVGIVVILDAAADEECFISKFSAGNKEWFLQTVLSVPAVQVRMYDESTAGFIGRKYDLAPLPTGTLLVLIFTYDGSGTQVGIKIYSNGVQIDNANDSGGAYTAMEPLAAPVEVGRRGDNWGKLSGQSSFPFIVGKELPADEVWSITQLLLGLLGK